MILTVTSDLDAIAGQTCMATIDTTFVVDDCCDNENSVAITNVELSPIACPNDTNGAIDVTSESTNPNFPAQFLWSNGATTEDIMNLPPDTYSLTITNEAGCQDSISRTFVLPNALMANSTVTDPSCGGLADGSILITATGGRQPYTYNIGDGNGFVLTNQFNDLDTGDYEVIVRDDSGCEFPVDGIELDDKELVITFDTMPVSCFGLDDGQVIIPDPPNGTAPFSYSINGSAPLSVTALSNLAPGAYTIDVFDAEGCTGTPVEFQLSEPESFEATIGSTARPTCNGFDDGSAIATPAGGTAPFEYLWNNGTTEQLNTGLLAGNYSVTITDNNGCTAESDTIELVDVPLLEVNIDTVIDASCSNENDGEIQLTATGGIGGFEFSLDGINFENGTTISNLSPDNYGIVIQDANECFIILDTITIAQPDSLSFTLSTDTDICYGDSISFTNRSTFTRGNPVAVTWDINGIAMTGDSISVPFTTIGNPMVTLTVETDLGCEATISEELALAVIPCCDLGNGLDFFVLAEDPLCANDSTGRISLNTSSIPPITNIVWNTNASTDIIDSLAAGDYSVTVTNDATCDSVIMVTLNEPAPIEWSFTITEPTCEMASNGVIEIMATGGTIDPTSDYEFNFDAGFAPISNFDSLRIGNYSIMIRDDNNCVVTADTSLAVPDGFMAIDADLTIITPTCDMANNGGISVTASGNGGNFEFDFNDGTGFSTDNSRPNLPTGNYSITIRDGDMCTLEIDTALVVPDGFMAIDAILTVISPTCEVANNGAIVVTASGNGGNFEFDFNDGNGFSTQNSLPNIPIGDYMVTIRDGDMCTLQVDTSLAIPDGFMPINAQLMLTTPSCEAATNGEITVVATGNGGNFEFDFDDGMGFSVNNNRPNLPIGNYMITVRDEDMCTLEIDTSLAVAPDADPVQATLQLSQPSCGGGTDGVITINPSGELGTNIANYTFNFGTGDVASNTDMGLPIGNYTITVTNLNNCSITLDTMLAENVLVPSDMPLVTRPTCFRLADGSIQFEVPNGVAPFVYDFGDGNFLDENALSNLPQGTYNIRIRDSVLCLSEVQVIMVDQPEELALTLTPTNISCFGANDGQIVADVSGGVGNFTYNWNTGQTTNIIDMLSAGDFSLDVTDGNNCPISSEVITIIEPDELLATIQEAQDVLCFGDPSGAITITASGGSAPYQYSLDGITLQDNPTLMNLPAGDYTVVVTDSRNCEINAPSVTIDEPDEFIVTASVDNAQTNLGFSVNLTAQANTTTPGNINYTWTTPDSVICSNCQSFETVPPGSTTFTVIATNPNNCQATDAISVAVSLDRPIFIPNIFSPNGDGINDEFFIPFPLQCLVSNYYKFSTVQVPWFSKLETLDKEKSF